MPGRVGLCRYIVQGETLAEHGGVHCAAGGATALLLASQVPHGRWASWIGVPAVMIGSLGMLIIALLMNLVAPGRRYPTFW